MVKSFDVIRLAPFGDVDQPIDAGEFDRATSYRRLDIERKIALRWHE